MILFQVQAKLVRRTEPNNLLFIGELLSGGKDFKPKMDELACFLPGTLALGVKNGMPQSHLDLARDLVYTCYLTFARYVTVLGRPLRGRTEKSIFVTWDINFIRYMIMMKCSYARRPYFYSF